MCVSTPAMTQSLPCTQLLVSRYEITDKAEVHSKMLTSVEISDGISIGLNIAFRHSILYPQYETSARVSVFTRFDVKQPQPYCSIVR